MDKSAVSWYKLDTLQSTVLTSPNLTKGSTWKYPHMIWSDQGGRRNRSEKFKWWWVVMGRLYWAKTINSSKVNWSWSLILACQQRKSLYLWVTLLSRIKLYVIERLINKFLFNLYLISSHFTTTNQASLVCFKTWKVDYIFRLIFGCLNVHTTMILKLFMKFQTSITLSCDQMESGWTTTDWSGKKVMANSDISSAVREYSKVEEV